MKYSRNILPRKNIFHATGRNILSQGENSCDNKKFPVTGRNLMSQEEIACHRKKFLFKRRNFLSQEDISCHRKKSHVTGGNCLSQEEISSHREKFPVTGENFPSLEKTSCHWLLGYFPPCIPPHFVVSLFVIVMWLYALSLSFKRITHTSDTSPLQMCLCNT